MDDLAQLAQVLVAGLTTVASTPWLRWVSP